VIAASGKIAAAQPAEQEIELADRRVMRIIWLPVRLPDALL